MVNFVHLFLEHPVGLYFQHLWHN